MRCGATPAGLIKHAVAPPACRKSNGPFPPCSRGASFRVMRAWRGSARWAKKKQADEEARMKAKKAAAKEANERFKKQAEAKARAQDAAKREKANRPPPPGGGTKPGGGARPGPRPAARPGARPGARVPPKKKPPSLAQRAKAALERVRQHVLKANTQEAREEVRAASVRAEIQQWQSPPSTARTALTHCCCCAVLSARQGA